MDVLRGDFPERYYESRWPRKPSANPPTRVVADDFIEVATIGEGKAQLRIEHNAEDALIGELIEAARRHIEDYVGLSLVKTTVTVVVDNMRGKYQLPYGPFIDTFVLTDENDTVITDSNYKLLANGNHVFLDYSGYGTHSFSYIAGFEEAPVILKRAVLFYLEYLYDPSDLGKKSKEKAENLANSFRTQTAII